MATVKNSVDKILQAASVRYFVSPPITSINRDPFILEAGVWNIPANVTVSNGSTATGVACDKFFTDALAGNAWVLDGQQYPINPNRTYSLTANLYAAAGNTRNMYVLIQFFDKDGTVVSSAVTGWGGSFSGYTFGGLPTAGVWSRQGAYIGAGTARIIPPSVRTCQIGVWFQYTGTGSGNVQQAAQDIRLTDVTEAAAAQIVAAQAQADATAAINSLTAIFADSVLDRSEKADVIQRWLAADAEYSAIAAQATALSVSSSAYSTAMGALNAYLGGLSPTWSDTTQNTIIVRADANTAWNNYYAAKVALLNAIAAKTATMATGVTLSSTGALSGGGTSGQMETLPVLDGRRETNQTPAWYPVGNTREFKHAGAIGLNDTDGYWTTLETIKQYTAGVGGFPGYQYCYQLGKTWRRMSADDAGSAWTAWVQDLDRNAYTGDLNATAGATAGTNLKDSTGTVMTDARITNGYTENRIGHVVRPLGGSYSSGPVAGALEILLPTAGYYSMSMLRIRIEIYEYTTGRSCTYVVSGYNYPSGPQWLNCTAEYSGPVAGRKRVRFGHNSAGTRNAIWIGDGTAEASPSAWSYPNVRISEVVAGYSNYDWSTWASGWSVSVVGTITGTALTQVTTPGVGGAMAGIDYISTTNAPNYVQAGAITDTMIGGNIASTNWNGGTGLSGAGWLMDRSGNLYANSAVFRGAIMGGSYTGYSWPAGGSGLGGFYLGPSGLLLGNYNDGKYIEIHATGDLSAPGFTIVNGTATFSGVLAAASGTFGAISLAPGGNIKSGQTAYDTGPGFFLGNVAGNPKFSMKTASGAKFLCDPANNIMSITGATVTFTPLVISGLPDSFIDPVANGSVYHGTVTAVASGGLAPYTYSWSGTTGSVSASPTTGATVGIYSNAYNAFATGLVVVTVIDANGRTGQGATYISSAHGSVP